MKKIILISCFAFASMFANAQVQVLSTGLVGVGTTAPVNQFDIKALPNPSTTGNSYNGLNCFVDQPSLNYGYGITSNVTNNLTKAIAVQYNGLDNFVVYGNGNGWCQGSFIFSDRTLKENIDTLRGALRKVLKLQGVTYNLKPSVANDPHPKKQIGLIAQDVEVVLPEAVATNDKGIKGVAYQNIVALLIEALKEEDKKITQLERNLDSCCSKKTNQRTQSDDSNQGNSESIINIQLANNSVLYQNEPNPYSSSTTIRYYIPGNVTGAYIIFYDSFGKEMKKVEVQQTGAGKIEADTQNLADGVYSYSLVVGNQVIDTKKMLKTK